jgi:hypothetical protein
VGTRRRVTALPPGYVRHVRSPWCAWCGQPVEVGVIVAGVSFITNSAGRDGLVCYSVLRAAVRLWRRQTAVMPFAEMAPFIWRAMRHLPHLGFLAVSLRT